MDEDKCQWCDFKIGIDSNIVLVCTSKILDGKEGKFPRVLKEDVVCIYHPECWEEFIKSIPKE